MIKPNSITETATHDTATCTAGTNGQSCEMCAWAKAGEKRKPAYSHSSLSTYRACPLKYRLKYELKLVSIQPVSRHDADFGNAWDAGVSTLYMPNGSLSKALEAFSAAYPADSYPAQLPVGSQGKTFANGLAALKGYVKQWREDDSCHKVLHVQERNEGGSDRILKLDLITQDLRDGEIYGWDTKAQPLYSQILTPDGWKTIGEMVTGSPIFGRDGNVYEVTAVQPRGQMDCYEITFEDNTKVRSSGDHLWTVINQYHKKEVTLTLDEISRRMAKKIGKEPHYHYQFRVPVLQPVRFPESALPVDPYLLGLLLGDGYLSGSTPQLSIGTKDAEEVCSYVKECLWEPLRLVQCKGNFSWSISGKNRTGGQKNPLMAHLEYLGLRGKKSHDKFIPEFYLRSSVKQRTKLLQGLLDTDGCCYNGRIYFDSTSDRLIEGVIYLVRSLGGFAKLYLHSGGKSHRVSIRFDNDVIPFRLQRKIAKLGKVKRSSGKYIKKIESVGSEVMRCIKTSAPDGLYVTDGFTLTHNTTGSYLDANYWGRFQPNSQIRMYAAYIKEKFGHCGGFYINAASFKHRSKAYTPRQGPDKGVQQPAGDWFSFARMVFNPNGECLALEDDNFAYWAARIQADKLSGNWGYNDQSCHMYGVDCEYLRICEPGYSWEADEELIRGYYRQMCPKVLAEGRCQLDWHHEGEHDPTITPQTDYQIEEDVEEYAVSD